MAASTEELNFFNDLVAKGCCKRCILRYWGQDEFVVTFEHPDTSLINFGLISPLEEFESGPSWKRAKSNPCSVCLGVLEDETIEAILQHNGLVKAAEYSSDTYLLHFTYTSCALLRDHSMKIYLKRRFPTFFKDTEVISLRTACNRTVINQICKKVNKKYHSDSTLNIHVILEYAEESSELSECKQTSRHKIADFLNSVSDESFKEVVQVPPRFPTCSVTIKDVVCYGGILHLIGSYCKYSRELIQRLDFSKGEVLKDEKSVEILIKDGIRQVAGESKEIVFRASSFDEANWRILGKGRTFHLQIIDPKFHNLNKTKLDKIRKTIKLSKELEVKNLRLADKRDINYALTCEAMAPHTYKIVCALFQCKNLDHCVNAINMYNTINVMHKIPIRMLAERSYVVKWRKVFYIKAKKAGEDLIEIDLCVESGLHVDEFVDGDLGRTTPSIAEIVKTDVCLVALDILDLQATLACAIDENDVVI